MTHHGISWFSPSFLSFFEHPERLSLIFMAILSGLLPPPAPRPPPGPCRAHMYPRSPATQTEACVSCIVTKRMARRIVNSIAAQWEQMNECSLAAGEEKRREICPYKLMHSAQLHVNCSESFIFVNRVKCLIGVLSFFGARGITGIRIRMHRNATQHKCCFQTKRAVQGNLNTV